LEQSRRKLGAILWRNFVIFGKNFSDGRILSAILLESRSKSSHLGHREACTSLTASAPLLQGQQCQLNDYTSLTIAEMPLQRGDNCHSGNGEDACASTARTPSHQGQQCQCDDGKYACASIMTKTPLQQGQRCLLENGNDSIATRETMPLWIKGNNTIVTRATMLAQQQQGHLRIDNSISALVMRPTVAMVTMAKMPVSQWQWCHCNKRDNTSSTMVEMPAHQRWQ
jgi:hypothetical protein